MCVDDRMSVFINFSVLWSAANRMKGGREISTMKRRFETNSKQSNRSWALSMCVWFFLTQTAQSSRNIRLEWRALSNIQIKNTWLPVGRDIHPFDPTPDIPEFLWNSQETGTWRFGRFQGESMFSNSPSSGRSRKIHWKYRSLSISVHKIYEHKEREMKYDTGAWHRQWIFAFVHLHASNRC